MRVASSSVSDMPLHAFLVDFASNDYHRISASLISISCTFYSLWIALVGLKCLTMYQHRRMHVEQINVRSTEEISEEIRSALRLFRVHVLFTISFVVLGYRSLARANAIFDFVVISKFVKNRWRQESSADIFWLTVSMWGMVYFMGTMMVIDYRHFHEIRYA